MIKDLSEIEIHKLFEEWSNNCKKAEKKLTEYFYPKIKNIAKRQFKNAGPSSLQTTEIVNEAFLKFNQTKKYKIQQGNQFLSLCSKIIRSIVVDHYRDQSRLKRGGDKADITIEKMVNLIDQQSANEFAWLEIDELIKQLEKIDPIGARIVELKIFGGFPIPEIAEVLNVSESTVSRNWKVTRLWLLSQIT